MTPSSKRTSMSEHLVGPRRGTIRRSFLTTAVIAGLALANPARAQDTSGARSFIENVATRTVTILKDPALGKDAKLDRLVAMLDDTTNLQLVAQLVLGRYWRTATPAQRTEYVRLFEAVLIKAMARRLNSYGGETFVIANARSIDERDAEVETQVVRPTGGAPIRIKWRVRQEGGRFAIVDIVAEDVSMVVTYRSEVAEIVSRDGMEGLIAAMHEWLNRPV